MPDTLSVDPGSLIVNLLDGVFVCTKTGEILFANPAFSSMIGLPSEKFQTKNMAKDIFERELEWKALVSLLEQGSQILDYETKVKRADGTVRDMSISAINYRSKDGVQIGIACVMRDITTRKGVENDIREKAFNVDMMNRIAKMAGGNTDIRRNLTFLSDDLSKLIDFDSLSVCVTEEKGRHVDVYTPDPTNPDVAKSLGRVPFEGSVVEKLKYGRGALIVDKDVTRKMFSEFEIMDMSAMGSMVSVPLMSRGRILGALNIASRKHGVYTLESAETLEMVADQLSGVIDNMSLLESLEKKIRLQETLVRSGVELQKAISTEQIYAAIASHIQEVVPYRDLSFYLVDWPTRMVIPAYAVGNYAKEVMAFPGTLDEGIVGVVAKSGVGEFVDDVDSDPRGAVVPGTVYEHNSMLAIPLVGTDGVLGVIELYRERGHVFATSDLEAGMLFAQQASVSLANSQLVAKLQDAKKEIELLNDLMFHDINNYNFATLNYVETISQNPGLPQECKDYASKALHLIRLNAKLIENVKKLTKIGIMNSQDFVAIDLCDVLRRVSSAAQTSTPNKRVSIKLNLPESGAHIRANPIVEELFVNILNNSVKYDPHEDVDIDVDMVKVIEDQKLFWKTSISDRGIGVPDDKKGKLFQKYVRLKPDTKIAGTGLGLSVCKALADKFNGRIWVEDRTPGKSELGARFCVVFPAIHGVD
jgi:PAS domain S-box-containing protein